MSTNTLASALRRIADQTTDPATAADLRQRAADLERETTHGHPVRPGDVIRVHAGVRVDDGHDLSGMRLTVVSTATSRATSATAVEVDPAHAGDIQASEWTGCPPVWLHEHDVDVVTPTWCTA